MTQRLRYAQRNLPVSKIDLLFFIQMLDKQYYVMYSIVYKEVWRDSLWTHN